MLQPVSLSFGISATEYFERIRPLGGAILLDSGKPACTRGRYDILVAEPQCQLSYHRGELLGTNLPIAIELHQNPFDALEGLYQYAKAQTSNIDHLFPFCGGLVGHFGYDLGRVIEQLPTSAEDDTQLPEMHVGLYHWAIIIDHLEERATWVPSPLFDSQKQESLLQTILTEVSSRQDSPFKMTSAFKSNTSEEDYHKALKRIDDYIHAGDCYQVNFAQRFSATCEGDPWQAYKQLREEAPTHYAAYYDTPQGAVLSYSPECFLAVDSSGHVITQPIKGTRPRGQTPEEDQALAEQLRSSEKDRAENVMIVDLLRNDLSKVCKPHSVKVPSLFDIEHYKNVHHLVSTVVGTLSKNQSPIDLLRNCFPGGSITGAPKIRSMEIIDELEAHRRSIYCGSIGYISLSGSMDTSITIRTLLIEENKVHCWAGGGIVADSISQMEYQETYDKVNNLLEGLYS